MFSVLTVAVVVDAWSARRLKFLNLPTSLATVGSDGAVRRTCTAVVAVRVPPELLKTQQV